MPQKTAITRKVVNKDDEYTKVVVGPQLPDVTDKSKDIKECNVPIEFIAKELKIGKVTIREMIKDGIFTFGTYRIINGKTTFYCSSKLLFEQRGIVYGEC